jgi:hypothetical protein
MTRSSPTPMGSANSNIVQVTLPNTSTKASIQTAAAFTSGTAAAFLPPSGNMIEDIQTAAAFVAGSYTPVDPDFADVVLLLHMDGTNGSSSFPDSSSVGNVMTPMGTSPPTVDTASPMFGSGAMLLTTNFAGSLQCPITPNGPLDLNGLFTIEGWVKFTNFSAEGVLADDITGTTKWELIVIGGVLQFEYFDSRNSGGPAICTAPAGMSTNTWYAFAIVGNGNTNTLFLNGVAGAASRPIQYPAAATTGGLSIGAKIAGNFAGQMDELRITNGVARYTGNYTPSGPFPNS